MEANEGAIHKEACPRVTCAECGMELKVEETTTKVVSLNEPLIWKVFHIQLCPKCTADALDAHQGRTAADGEGVCI